MAFASFNLKYLSLLCAPSVLLACGNGELEDHAAGTSQALSAVSVTLVDAGTGAPIPGYDPIADGATITLEELPTQQLSLKATPSSSVVSLELVLDGSFTHYENIAPYSLCGDATTSYTPCPQLNTTGAHTLTLRDFSGQSGSGTPGAAVTLRFSVQTSGATTPPPTTPPPTTPPPATPPPAGPIAFPLKVSANARYLVDQNGVPFPILGDSAWEAEQNLTPDDQLTYLADRVARGFNSVLLTAIEHKFTQAHKPPADFAGNLPFGKRLDGNAYTGSPNGTDSTSGSGTITAGNTFAPEPYSNISTQSPDFTYPVAAYWTQIDGFLSRAAEKGMAVFMFPAYLGFGGGDEGWARELAANDAVVGAGGLAGQSFANNGKSRVWNYGAWLAQRYANYKNIVWVLGGDFGALSSAQSTALTNLLDGMKSISGQQSRLWTAHWARPSYGSDLAQFNASLDIESVYVNANSAVQARTGYAHTPTRPAFQIEGYYEDNPNGGTPIRRLQWWSLFGAPAGQFFGSTGMWSVGSNWRAAMDTPGTRDQAQLNTFVRSVAWHNLVPSGLAGQKTIAVSNGGTLGQADYVACAGSSSLTACYVPPGWGGSTLGVDATVLSAPFRARWLNPFTGAYSTISTNVVNSGTASFTPPGNNGSGFKDWVLVLDTAGATSSTTSTPPTFTSAASSNANPVNGLTAALSALASDDGGEGALTYSWSTTGTPPATVAFSANGSNAAKQTAATFSKGGTYGLRVTATDVQGQTATSQVNVTVAPTLTSIVVSPADTSVTVNGTRSFSAVANDQFGQALSPAPTFTWSVSGGGNVDGTGLFTAGSTAGGPFNVIASSSGKTGSGRVTVTSTPAQDFTVGQTSIFANNDSGNGGCLSAQQVTLTRSGTLQSLSFYVGAPAGALRLGLYDASGPSGTPGQKLAESSEGTPGQAGWITLNVSSGPTLAAGTYWLAYFGSSNSLVSRKTGAGSGRSVYCNAPASYGAMPATFFTNSTADTVVWSFFANFKG